MMLETLTGVLEQAADWVMTEMWRPAVLVQEAWILLSLAAGFIFSRFPARWLDRPWTWAPAQRWLTPFRLVLRELLFPFLSLLFLLLYSAAAKAGGWEAGAVHAAVSLAVAWIIIRLASSVIRQRGLARWVAFIAWSIAALDIIGVLDEVLGLLDGMAISIGKTRLSLLMFFEGLAVMGLLLWGAGALSRLLEQKIRNVPHMAPSLQVLTAKLVRIVLIMFAFLVGLNMIGIDFTALAVFSGALGVGLGFGLQKLVSNFLGGLILLMDRSIKPGDVIAVDQTFGWVNRLGARHVSVITRDGKEHLIPNESLITGKVENWSYSNDNIRLRIPLRISYQNDPRQAIALAVEAAKQARRVLTNPPPLCLVHKFGESAIELELRVWINDPANGVGNITSEVLLHVWDSYQQNGIVMPYPQQDVHVVSLPAALG